MIKVRSAGTLNRLLWASLSATALLIFSAPSQAQEDSGGDIWRQGGCFNCHGLMANGDGDAAYPAGPNLMRSALDRDMMIAVVGCGRPGTTMPMNLAGAYTEIACYELPLGEAPGVSVGATFTEEQVATLVDFLLENVVGQTRVTREYCATFYGGNIDARACLQY